MAEEEATINEVLSKPILLAERVLKSVQEAETSKPECSEIGKRVERLAQLLRSTVHLASASTPPFYDRPFLRIAATVSKNLERAYNLVRRCKHSGAAGLLLRQVFVITSTSDFNKLSDLLESSIADMTWLLSTVFNSDEADNNNGVSNISLPPITSNYPILAWVWSYIASLQTCRQLRERTLAATDLSSLAKDNDLYTKIIVQEGGVSPLLKLLEEGASSDSQIAAAHALFNLATNADRVQFIVNELGVPPIVKVLGDSTSRVRVCVANLVSRMAELDTVAQDEFGKENAIKPLVTLLLEGQPKFQSCKTSFHSLVQINTEIAGKTHHNHHHHHHHNNHQHHHHHHYQTSNRLPPLSRREREREGETEELKLKLKVSSAEALWRLSRGNVSNCRKITETTGLLCLAKLIESSSSISENGQLQFHCLMAVTEIAAVAESIDDIKRMAFKPSSLAGKAVLDQLLRVVQEEKMETLLIPAIKATGCLARIFPTKETRIIIRPLVALLGRGTTNGGHVAAEAAITLGKFASPENFNGKDNSKAIIEFGGIEPLMRLLKSNEQTLVHKHALALLCFLALNVGNSRALEEVHALSALEAAAAAVRSHSLYPDLRDLLAKAIHHLTLYQAGVHPHRHTCGP